MKRAPRLLLASLVIVAIVVGVLALVAHEPALPAVAAGTQPADAALVARGSELAAVGNCRGCHTAPQGPALGGGVPLHSPVGIIYSTNISPDPETGIGRWSEAAFLRAMRKGVARDGTHLYPAFPYERFTKVTDEDDKALYAWLMAQPPVRSRPPANTLPFPFNARAGIALWKVLFLEEGPGGAPRGPDAHGAYLVDSLGHCGSCHSPRNWAYAEDEDRELQGGDAEGWHAYAIQADNRAVKPWTAPELAFYLRNGFHPQHGISRGTMGLVTGELRWAAQADIDAMARAVVARMQAPRQPRVAWWQAVQKSPLAPRGTLGEGEAMTIYRTSCEACHDGSRPPPFGGLPLALSTGVSGESSRNLVNVILHGIAPAGDGATTPMMPAFGGALSDAQVESLVAWLRTNLTDEPAWPDVAKNIREARAMDASMLRFPPGGSGADPLATGAR